MKLHEFKTKFMSLLTIYQPKSGRERELRDLLISKLNYLRMMVLPNFLLILYEIIEHENVSEDFKRLCKEMVADIQKLKVEE